MEKFNIGDLAIFRYDKEQYTIVRVLDFKGIEDDKFTGKIVETTVSRPDPVGFVNDRYLYSVYSLYESQTESIMNELNKLEDNVSRKI